MNRFAILASLFFACSPVKGTPLIDAEVVDVQSLQIQPSSVPQLSAGIDAPVQLSVQATLSIGGTRDVTPYVTWSSSNSSAISIDATGLATALAAGSATITATFNGSTATLPLSARSAILILTEDSNRVDFFDASVTGSDVTPIRTIQGSATGITSEPFSAWPDGSNNEVFVAMRGTGINVYPLDGSGNIPPIRSIPIGSASTLVTEVVNAVIYKSELYVLAVATGSGGTQQEEVLVFDPKATGSAATPKRTIGGSATELIEGTYGLWVANDTIYVGQTTNGSNAVVEFPVSASGNVAPTTQLGGSAFSALQPLGFATVGEDLIVADDGLEQITAVDASGTVVRRIKGSHTNFAGPTGIVRVGDSLVCAEQSGYRIDIYPLEGTEDIPPTATISGSASGISVPIQITAY